MLGHIGQDQVGRNWRHLIEAGFTKLSFHIVFTGKAETTVELQTGVRRFPAGFCRKVFGHIRLRPAGLSRIVERTGFIAHQIGRLDLDKSLGDRELNALVLPDRPPEYLTLADVFTDPVREPITISDTFGSDQRALCIEAGQDVFKALSLFANQVLFWDFQIIKKQLVGFVIDHIGDGLHGHAAFHRLFDIDEEDRKPLGFLFHLVQRRSARQQNHQIGMLNPADPDFLAVDHITVALLDRRCLDLGGIRPCGWLRHTHGLQAQFAFGNQRQVFFPLLLRPVAHQSVHIIHLTVTGTRVAACAVDLFHDHRGFGQAKARSAIIFGDERGHPPFFRQRIDKCLGIAAFSIDFAMVLIRKLRTERANAASDVLKVLIRIGHGIPTACFQQWYQRTLPSRKYMLLMIRITNLYDIAWPRLGSDMDVRQLRYFVTIVEQKSITRAASILHVAQPALSLHLKNMEEHLQTKLLLRSRSGVDVTEAGALLFRRARTLLEDLAKTEDDIRNLNSDPGGTVRIGLPGTISGILALPLIEAVRRRYPKITLNVAEAMSGFVEDWLIDARVDIAVLYNRCKDQALVSERLLEEELVALWPRQSERPKEIAFNDLNEVPMVLPSVQHGLRTLINSEFLAKGVAPDVALEIDSYANIKKLVAAGVGASILPLHAVHREEKAGDLVLSRFSPPGLRRNVYLTYPANRQTTRAQEVVRELVRETVADLIDQEAWIGATAASDGWDQ